MDRLRIVVAYNDDVHLKQHLSEVERLGEQEVAGAAQEVAEILGAGLLPVRDVPSALEQLRRERPEVVFNLCEGVAGRPAWEMHFALALEMIGLPFTGCDPVATGICSDKALTKRLLATGGFPTPPPFNGSDDQRRWMVKPRFEDAGVGIEAASVCRGRAAVLARSRWVEQTYRQEAVVEEFIEGAELNQALFQSEGEWVVLPPGEILFSQSLSSEERVVGWKAKWAEGSAEDRGTRNRTPAEIDPALRQRIADLCRGAADLLALGGYCRFDLRQRAADGELFILDVNANPDIGRGSGFRRALDAAGIEFADFLKALIMSALHRRK